LEEHLQGFWLGSAHNRTDMVGPGLAAGDDNLLRTSWPDIANICYHKNGVDCGPMVVALVDIFLRAGIQYKQVYQVQLPHLECAHKTRARMLEDLMEGIKNSHGLWRRLTSNGVKFELAPTDSQLNIVGSDQHLVTQKCRIERHLINKAVKCAG